MTTQPWHLLWYDATTKKSLTAKIADACDRFQAKYGITPAKVRVPMAQYDESIQIDGLDIVGAVKVLRNHIEVWPPVGVDEPK